MERAHTVTTFRSFTGNVRIIIFNFPFMYVILKILIFVAHAYSNKLLDPVYRPYCYTGVIIIFNFLFMYVILKIHSTFNSIQFNSWMDGWWLFWSRIQFRAFDSFVLIRLILIEAMKRSPTRTLFYLCRLQYCTVYSR